MCKLSKFSTLHCQQFLLVYKTSLQKVFIIDGVSTTDTTKICNCFWRYFIDHPKKHQWTNPGQQLPSFRSNRCKWQDNVFCQATETEIVESVMQLNKEGGIYDVSRKFLIMCKNHVSYYLKEPFNFCIDSLVFPNVFKMAQIHPIIKKGSLRNILNYRPVSVLNNLSKVFKKFYLAAFKVFVTHPTLSQKNQLGLVLLSAFEDKKFAICFSGLLGMFWHYLWFNTVW